MVDYESFDLDRSTAQAWADFEQRLAGVISVVDETADFTVGCVTVNADQVPYVRFHSLDRDTLVATAASNAVLGEEYQLRVAQLQQMEDLGWNSPASDGRFPSADFWVIENQENDARLASIAVQTLRDVYGVQHPVFLAPDQLAEILQPRPEPLAGVSEFDAEDVVATIPVSREHLQDMVEAELAEMFGHSPIHDDEGDITIRVGSTMLFLKLSGDGREVVLFAAVVHDVEGRSRATEVLNDLNSETRTVKFQLVRDRVFVTMSVLAHPFVPAHLHQAVSMMSEVADGIDDDLAVKLRGRTTFGDSPEG